MKKKIIIFLTTLIIILIGTGIITNYADTGRVTTNHEPKYCFKLINKEENKITYIGLGYKVVRYVKESIDEPYENNIGVKMGSWFMKYTSPIDSNNQDTKIKTLNDFYNTTATKDNDIRILRKEYSTADAIKDNCFASFNSGIYNEEVYNSFMEKYKNKETAFIRVGNTTIEGDLMLYDILYYEPENKVYLVTDFTRDVYGSEREIELTEYENLSEYTYENKSYLVLYNGELNEETFYSSSVNIVAFLSK